METKTVDTHCTHIWRTFCARLKCVRLDFRRCRVPLVAEKIADGPWAPSLFPDVKQVTLIQVLESYCVGIIYIRPDCGKAFVFSQPIWNDIISQFGYSVGLGVFRIVFTRIYYWLVTLTLVIYWSFIVNRFFRYVSVVLRPFCHLLFVLFKCTGVHPRVPKYDRSY